MLFYGPIEMARSCPYNPRTSIPKSSQAISSHGNNIKRIQVCMYDDVKVANNKILLDLNRNQTN